MRKWLSKCEQFRKLACESTAAAGMTVIFNDKELSKNTKPYDFFAIGSSTEGVFKDKDACVVKRFRAGDVGKEGQNSSQSKKRSRPYDLTTGRAATGGER